MAARKKTSAPRRKTPRRSGKRGAGSGRARSAVREASELELPIVYIHGIGDQPPKATLKREWDLALFGSEQTATRMAYWADILHPGARRKKKVRTRSRPVPGDVDVSELLAAAGLDRDDDAAAAFIEAFARDLAARGGGDGRRSGPRAKFLPLPGMLRRPVAEAFLRRLIPDTAAYFFRSGVRARVQKRLRDALPDGPFVLVAHSQGTIVSYEVLSKLRRDADVALHLTIGSPLGIQEVQDFIEPGAKPLAVPGSVRRWRNFADRLDPVALDAGLASDFAASGGGVQIEDDLVLNRSTASLNPHAAVGYLAHPKVRAPVHAAVRFDTMSRFVVARDVAEGFADRAARQPVLIETLDPGYGALGESPAETDRREAAERRQGVLGRRNERLADELGRRLDSRGVRPADARVDVLRRYVAAHLTADEIDELAASHAALNVYAVWRSTTKRKLLERSHVSIKADAARESYGAEGDGITWAVLDTGARLDHPHFRTHDTIAEVLDCTRPGSKPTPITSAAASDRDGHGTHVAGIIAGEGTFSRGAIKGVAPRARLVVYKVLDDEGQGEDAWILKALDDIYERNERASGLEIHGLNLSLGGPFDPTVYGCGFSPICQGVRELWRNGVVACVAAGNEGQIRVLTHDGDVDLNTQLSIGDPANLEEAIAVGSVNADKPNLYGVSHFSSRGPTADGRGKPDVVAPGERIRSCNTTHRSGARYRHDSGTSMACPHVSGLLAAFLSVRRELIGEPDKVKQILLDGCNDLGRDPYHQGAGIPNLMKMLLNA